MLAAVRKHANVYFPTFLFSAFLMKTLGYCRITLRYLEIMAGYLHRKGTQKEPSLLCIPSGRRADIQGGRFRIQSRLQEPSVFLGVKR